MFPDRQWILTYLKWLTLAQEFYQNDDILRAYIAIGQAVDLAEFQETVAHRRNQFDKRRAWSRRTNWAVQLREHIDSRGPEYAQQVIERAHHARHFRHAKNNGGLN